MADIPMGLPRSPHRQPPVGIALWALGFRPFYLLAALLAAVSVPLWALQFSGLIQHAWLRGPVWHAHEMVFGFTLAVIIGFLFTAGRNWSGQPTPTGVPLMALAALWVAGRVLVLTPWGWAAAAVNVAVPLWAAWGLWRALKAGGNRRNYFFVGLLVALALACAAVHAQQAWGLVLPWGTGLAVALDVALFIIAVMGGRVIPMFSNNGVPGMQATRQPQVEQAALGSVLALLVCDLTGAPGWLCLLTLMLALVAHTARWSLWQPWKTLHHPLVGVLHLAYAWLLVHLGLRAAAVVGAAPAGLATHALTVGLIGTITLGMMTRTALGHTGRPLRAGRPELLAYGLVTAAALARVIWPWMHPASLVSAVLLSALLWSAAFACYLVRYAPWLCRPRADGMPG